MSRRLAGVLAVSLLPVAAGAVWRSGSIAFVATVVALSLVAVAVAVRRGLPRRGDLATVAVLAAVVGVLHPFFGLLTLAGGLLAGSVLRSSGGIRWVRPRWGRDVALALVLGLALGAVNVVTAQGQDLGEPLGPWAGITGALRAGVSEEVGLRLGLLGVCLLVLRGRQPRGRAETVWTCLVLVVPHAALHVAGDPGRLVAGTLFLGILYGLPLTLLLLRRGVVAAVTAHTVIDLVRYAALGV